MSSPRTRIKTGLECEVVSRTLLVVLSLLMLVALQARAQTSRLFLDPTFGNGGRVLTDFSGQDGFFESLTVGQDGGIFSFGSAVKAQIQHAAIVKHQPDGRRDGSFGTGGELIDEDMKVARAALVQPDGKLVVAGGIEGGYPGEPAFAIKRYNADGSADTTFGNGGMILDSFIGPYDFVTSMALQEDGKILVGGNTLFLVMEGSQNVENGDFAIARYNADGSLDAAFGNGGKVTTDFYGEYDLLENILLQPDGKLVAGGAIGLSGNSGVRFGVSRYNQDGSLDASFGDGGKVTVNLLAFYSFIYSLTLQPDGKIITGSATIASAQYAPALIRLTRDGSPDPSFGNQGTVAAPIGYAGGIVAISVRPDGRLLAFGVGPNTNPSADSVVSAVMYDKDGTVDTSFGNGGSIGKRFFGKKSEIDTILFQPDGKVLAGGRMKRRSSGYEFALSRYTVVSN